MRGNVSYIPNDTEVEGLKRLFRSEADNASELFFNIQNLAAATICATGDIALELEEILEYGIEKNRLYLIADIIDDLETDWLNALPDYRDESDALFAIEGCEMEPSQEEDLFGMRRLRKAKDVRAFTNAVSEEITLLIEGLRELNSTFQSFLEGELTDLNALNSLQGCFISINLNLADIKKQSTYAHVTISEMSPYRDYLPPASCDP